MANETLTLKSIGPIKEANVQFGDLTVLVGPQASGKSIFLQFLKLVLDGGPVRATLRRHGLDWQGKNEFLDLYLGEGMRSVWHQRTSEVIWRNRPINPDPAIHQINSGREKCFLIPAQRVLTLSRESWLRPFTDYRPGDPFAVRDFSEKLRVFLDRPPDFHVAGKSLAQDIFSGLGLSIVKDGPQRRLVLQDAKDKLHLPFMVWSAGQREFVPLLLGLEWLQRTKPGPSWVVIEEPEMGLHPTAIEGVLFLILDLLHHGYRVCISTHSAQVLDVVWALRNLRESKAGAADVLRIFGARTGASTTEVGRAALKKQIKVYYFDRRSGKTRDISKLDLGAMESSEAEWGGLTEFSGRVADIVADAAARNGGMK
jgi:energy-coupling factor transporter ATP-binding protein EcfA2